MEREILSILRLFKSYIGEKQEEFSEDGLKYGLLIPKSASAVVIADAIKLYGKDNKKWNETFHKSFAIVRDTPIETLVAQQIAHYITTYLFEELGFYDSDFVYLPKEALDIPGLEVDKIELIPIKAITKEELTEKLMVLLTSGIALSKQTVEDIMVLSDYIDKERFDEICNREVKIALYEKYDIMPKDPEEFLRYLIFTTTGETLKIQNKELINKIKLSDRTKALFMLKSYEPKSKLSSIFLRNKNLFLAFKSKSYPELNAIINKLRKLANKNHKPMKKSILDCLTNSTQLFSISELPPLLDNITIFKEARIMNGVKYRLTGFDDIVYRIRNGKSYVKKLDNPSCYSVDYSDRLSMISELVYSHFIDRLSKKVKGKTIYIPSNVTYAFPTSEKQFNGNIPSGSYIEIPRNDDLIYGIHWCNLQDLRIDLDLKQMNTSQVFGWDASYRSDYHDIYFSGDVTNAPAPMGATELFYVGNTHKANAFLITVNDFNYSGKVPFEFIIAKGQHKDISKNYVINPNNILEKFNLCFEEGECQKVIGLIVLSDAIRFYFNDFTQGFSCTSRRDDVTMGAFNYLREYNVHQLKLNDVLEDAGAILTEKETITKEVTKNLYDEKGNIVENATVIEEVPVDYNLSPNSITKETLIGLLSNK